MKRTSPKKRVTKAQAKTESGGTTPVQIDPAFRPVLAAFVKNRDVLSEGCSALARPHRSRRERRAEERRAEDGAGAGHAHADCQPLPGRPEPSRTSSEDGPAPTSNRKVHESHMEKSVRASCSMPQRPVFPVGAAKRQ